MAPWYSDLPGLLDGIWRDLTCRTGGEVEARHVVLSTIRRGGGPQARIVVLRAADRAAGSVAMHTDALSEKYAEIDGDPRATLLSWDPAERLQLRLRGTMRQASGADVAEEWARVPETSRGSYGVTPAPGTPIAAADAYLRQPEPARFAVLTLRVAEIDAVMLTDDFHRRALFRGADGWRGTWLAP